MPGHGDPEVRPCPLPKRLRSVTNETNPCLAGAFLKCLCPKGGRGLRMMYLKEEVESREEDGSSIGGCGITCGASTLTRKVGSRRELLDGDPRYRRIRRGEL